MILTDTHTHLYSEEFDADRNEMIERAIQKGVSRFFVPSIDSSYTQKMYDLEKQFPSNIFLMMGLHPTYVKENYLEELAHVEQELGKRKFQAIGEIGIDLFWDKTFLKQQQHAFQYQIQLAKKHNLAINIHCRDAFDEVFEVLESEKAGDLFGIFHCFTGDYEQAKKAISLETDSPYLAPVPYRGKRNESSYTFLVAEKLASIYNVTIEEIAQVTTKNSKKIFGI